MYFIVLRENVIPRPQWPEAVLKAHLAWANEVFQSGGLLLSGPANDGQMGIHLIEAASDREAREILDRDRVNTEGYCKYKLIDWSIQRGKDKLHAT